MICISVFMPVSHCVDYCRFVVSFEIENRESPDFVFLFCFVLFLIFFVCCGLLRFHIHFSMNFFISEKSH